ncbi:MAG: HAMP domain-containing sensor histidine kinase [Nanoarchaeota archaeon]
MDIGSNIIETGVDRLLKLVKERGRILLIDAAKEIEVSSNEILEWVNLLGEEGAISIEYRQKKPYLVEKRLAKEEDYLTLKEAYRKFAEAIIKRITINSLKAEINMSFESLARKLDAFGTIENESLLHNSYSKFFEAAVKKAKLQFGNEELERIFKNAYNSVKKKYGNFPVFMQIFKAVPRGILEMERFDLLSKEEVEKVAKEMKRIEIMKSDFSNIAAHELRTPIVPIIGFLERLLKSPRKFKLTKLVQKQLEICLRNAKRLDSLVDDILSVSKLESGEMKFSFKNLNLKKIINNVKADFSSLAKKKKVRLNLKLPSKLPEIKGDEQRISQVLTNLIENAFKFTNRGSVTILAGKNGRKVVVQVKDTGIGIDQREIPKLFEEYFQIAPIENKQIGTGLGLAICKKIIRKHNGEIWVESELGKGSSFYFALPINR